MNARDFVRFAADTPLAARWMRRRCGGESIVFRLPVEHSLAIAFREAAELEKFSIVVLRRSAANM
ncbi:MAG TPA: hypothetical protein VK752_28020 [Bryobacteraceae bacterium]|nr:hypothetical protein [Bryobacteraceae bacterium]